ESQLWKNAKHDQAGDSKSTLNRTLQSLDFRPQFSNFVLQFLLCVVHTCLKLSNHSFLSARLVARSARFGISLRDCTTSSTNPYAFASSGVMKLSRSVSFSTCSTDLPVCFDMIPFRRCFNFSI